MSKVYGKSIRIYLMDGSPNGRMTCELSNWTGIAIKIPRNMLTECSDRRELSGTGIYLLFGKNPANPEEDMVYIGETDILFSRLKNHQNKDFWNEAIAFTSKDDNLNKAHVRYLERKLYDTTLDADRYKLENNNIPSGAKISEADQAEMDEFADNMKLMIHTLGHNVFEKLAVQTIHQDVFNIKPARGANATGIRTSEGFIVSKGSTIAVNPVKTFPDSYQRYRTELIDGGIIMKDGETLVFSKDYLFSSPSAAAMMVMGRTANGLIEWKLSDGRTLKEYEAG